MGWREYPNQLKRSWRGTIIETLLISLVVGAATGAFFALLVIFS